MLKIKDLCVSVDKKPILHGVDLTVRPGEVQVIMGPNGSGKSTLAYSIAGHPRYIIDKGQLTIDRKDLLPLTPDQRARAGVFLAFQYPVGVEGVTVEQLLRKVVLQGKIKGEKLKISALEFRKYLETEAKKLGIKKELLRRDLNEGFSGGEKKRMEILQLAVLKPKYAILDETDSGLDIDALRVIAGGVRQIAARGIGVILITHYQRILKFVKADKIHVMMGGKIVRSGGRELAEELDKKGYKKFLIPNS